MVLLLAALVSATGCDTWVEDVDSPESVITDDQLTSEDQIDFLMNGVIAQFSVCNGGAALLSADLSDELFFDSRNTQSVNTSYKEIDDADIPLINASVGDLFVQVSRLRFLSDDLVRRLQEIDFKDQGLKRRAEYTGYFYGGIARFYLAAYFGLTEREGGGVITFDPAEPGPFIPSNEMYHLALGKLESAAARANEQEARVINTISARIFLFLGDNVGAARIAAESGMIPGDEPFQSLHDATIANPLWAAAGPNTVQLLADSAYKAYIDDDPAEAVRLPLVKVIGKDSTIFYRQDRFSHFSDALRFTTWQENELILAELDLQDGNLAGARLHVNAERTYYGLDELPEVNLDTLQIERRKELWLMGLRLIDQRRFEEWHKDPDTWWFLPIPFNERDANPNL